MNAFEPLFLANFYGLGNILVVTILVLLASHFLNGIWVKGILEAFIVALVVAGVGILIEGFLNRLVSPLSFLPFQVAYIFVDAVLIYIADFLLKGFKVKDFWSALALAVVITLVQWIF